jgi:DHA1 family multidrug resistance protein-like MFS transporter
MASARLARGLPVWRIRLVRQLAPGRQAAEPWQRSLYTIVIAETLAMLGFQIVLPFLPFYIQDLGITDLTQVAFWVGLINAVPPLAMAITSPFWGLLADRYGRKPMLVRAMLAGSVIVSLMACVTNVQQLAALRVMQGALTGTIAAATVLVATMVPREKAGYALGLLSAGVYMGSWLGPSVGGLIGGTLGYRTAFFSAGGLLILATMLIVFLVSEKPATVPSQRTAGGGLGAAVRSIMAAPVVLWMILLLMMSNLSGSISGPVFPLFVQTMVPDVQAAARATGMILSATAVMNTIGALWIGRKGDRWSARHILILGLSVAALTFFPQALATQPYQLLILRGLLGFAMGALSPIANAGIARGCPEGRQGGIYGISTSLNSLGGAVGPLIGTYIVATWGLPAVFPATGFLLGLMALAVGFVVPLPGRGAVMARPKQPAGLDGQALK